MIPWRLTFSGVRDYPPTLMDLSGAEDHILITGPNGAGKSTITFCMGAVLYSSKVDIEGLKSRNLSVDQTWRAQISLLFNNSGLMKIDAPSFIEFTLKMVQEPGQPIKKEFSISSGENIEEWEETIRYTSGDRLNNFSMYKKDLQYKYKIDPDLFYLIWYQQEVNQFAIMHPEERFRVFSEMYGIDKVQRNWEESMEKVKETEETLRMAESNVKFMKQELGMKKTALNRFLDNQKRLHEGGTLAIESLLQLEVHYKSEIHRLEDTVEQLEEDIKDAKDDLALKKAFNERKAGTLKSVKTEQEDLERKIEATENALDSMDKKINATQSRINELDGELAAITKRKSQIIRTEEEVKAALFNLSQEEEQTQEAVTQNHLQLEEKKTAKDHKVEKMTRISLEVENDEKAENVHKERLRQYQSSHAIQMTIDSLETGVNENKEAHFTGSRQLSELEEELKLLQENRDFSPRQLESMRFFRIKGIKAYPLRELIELDEDAHLKDELLFDTIKYTIFFNGKQFEPPNDLYHVPLMNVIPDRSVEKLPALHLKVKEELPGEVMPLAIKALWWVEQFFKENPVRIRNGVLVDQAGYRGAQEKDRYILSQKALKARKHVVENSLQDLRAKLQHLEQNISSDTKKIQELNSIIHQVKESEAFMTNEHERILRKKKLDEERTAKFRIDEKIKQLELEKDQLTRKQLEQEGLRQVLEDEAAVYAELGKLKDKYEERNELLQLLEATQGTLKQEKQQLEHCEDDLERLKRNKRKLEREKDDLAQAIEDSIQKISRIERQRDSRMDDKEAMKLELVQVVQDLEEMKHWVPKLYNEVSEQVNLEELPSLAHLKQSCENGKVIFQNARTEDGIDHAAPDNYETVKLEYERLDNEYKRTSILLDQDKERMENLRDQLETTINMRVLELQQRFKTYMGHFQFEGEISWEPYEDRRKRTHFKLFIKARKEGHRGKLEDVSTKARGGKVGKGVSGGEESLSSLLFALALLQNLQTSPGFIVLDEFDSALDEERKVKVFDLYQQELNRKMIILTPKSHEGTYLNRFSKAFIVKHDPTVPKSKVVGIVKTN